MIINKILGLIVFLFLVFSITLFLININKFHPTLLEFDIEDRKSLEQNIKNLATLIGHIFIILVTLILLTGINEFDKLLERGRRFKVNTLQESQKRSEPDVGERMQPVDTDSPREDSKNSTSKSEHSHRGH